jgi:DNA polymerase V
VGIAPTKTLAKVANRLAKRDANSGGVRRLDEASQREALAWIELTDLWGIAGRVAKLPELLYVLADCPNT